MKKLLFTVVASAALLSPLAAAPSFAQGYDHNQGQQSQQNHGQQTQQDNRDHNGRGWQAEDANRGDRQDEARRSDRRDRYEHRRSWRDDRADARYDQSLHNGYYVGNAWHSGPPPQARYADQRMRLGYRPWARGQRLGYYSGRYAEVDYRQNHLRRPPHGYHWVRDNDGDYLLAGIVGGIIAQVILSGGR